ncbi:hypothetical protein ANN_02834 [Periplaneta americana]|uniref:Uncharacterized protein n=1 Tax=Periplaneta americana TaxID=6978 RepID=A0ABQ8TZ30_PERAM|nr:hypothetical protein ANN_02834 [Periplaneta americana]
MRQRVIALVEAGYGARSAGRLVGVPGSTAARSIIATALTDADYNIFEEVTGNTRRINIIAFKEPTRSGFIIDPTVRFETNEEQPAEVDKEKKNIYNPTILYYLQKYRLKELEVIWLEQEVVSTYLLISSAIDLHDILNDQSVNETSKKAKDPIIIGLLWTFLGVMGLHIVMSLLLLLGAVKVSLSPCTCTLVTLLNHYKARCFTQEVPVILCLWLAANVVFLVVVVSGMTVRIFLNPKRFLSSIGKRIFSVGKYTLLRGLLKADFFQCYATVS